MRYLSVCPSIHPPSFSVAALKQTLATCLIKQNTSDNWVGHISPGGGAQNVAAPLWLEDNELPGAKESLEVDLHLVMIRAADLAWLSERLSCPLERLKGAGMCQITGSEHSGRGTGCADSFFTDTVLLEWMDTHCIPLIIQQAFG